jgi:transposase InsO family protein
MKTRQQAAECLRKYITWVKAQVYHLRPCEKYTIRILLADRAGEYRSSEWISICEENEIDRRHVSAGVYEQAGVVERLWETLGNMVRAMI